MFVLNVFNGAFKNSLLSMDVVQIDPNDYDFDNQYMWFDICIATHNNDMKLSDFNFYLADSGNNILNAAYIKKKDSNSSFIGVFIGFEILSDFFYNTPTFAFYCDKKIELIQMG